MLIVALYCNVQATNKFDRTTKFWSDDNEKDETAITIAITITITVTVTVSNNYNYKLQLQSQSKARNNWNKSMWQCRLWWIKRSKLRGNVELFHFSSYRSGLENNLEIVNEWRTRKRGTNAFYNENIMQIIRLYMSYYRSVQQEIFVLLKIEIVVLQILQSTDSISSIGTFISKRTYLLGSSFTNDKNSLKEKYE